VEAVVTSRTDIPDLPAALTRLRVVTVLHHYATGAGQELHAWLRAVPIAESLLIEHPFTFSKRTHTRVERVCGDSTSVVDIPQSRGPMAVRYALDLLRTVCIVRHSKVTYDYYVGNGAFDTLAGIMLRRMGRVKHVVLYTIDYAPAAGGSRWYARVYRWIDRFCCRKADIIWNLSERMQDARAADGRDLARSAPAIRVPHGTHAYALEHLLPDSVAGLRVAFMGHVQEKSGVQLFIEVMPRLREEFPQLHLDVLGDGPFVPALRDLVHSKGLDDAVTFHGFIEDHVALEQTLMQCAIGIALYAPDLDDFSRYADPGKPKVYLACGLPVVIVDVPAVAQEIARAGAGLAISYSAAALSDAVRTILRSHTDFRDRARALAARYDWHDVFTRAWRDTFHICEDHDGN
jgi:glycosyltransferase involved in cell wall biosynthesis